MARLFGTDGVRGVAGEELSYELAGAAPLFASWAGASSSAATPA